MTCSTYMYCACANTMLLTFVWLAWRELIKQDLSVMANKRFTVFSRKLLLLLLVTPRYDLLCFSAQFGRSLILDPGVCASQHNPEEESCQVLGFS